MVLSSWLLTECSLNCTTPAWRLSILHGSASITASSVRARWLSKPASPEDTLCFRSRETTIHLQTKACLYLLNIHSKNKTVIQTTGRHYALNNIQGFFGCKKLSCLHVSAGLCRYIGKVPQLQIEMCEPNEPGRVRETHLAALLAPGQWREVHVHMK